MSSQLTCGIGFNIGEYPSKIGGRTTREYALWQNMLHRCYGKDTSRRSSSYKVCQISESFKDFSFFHRWCQAQEGFSSEGYHLDKDLLVKGNKLYSENTCIFLPPILNTLLTKRKAGRGDYPLGVNLKKGKFQARLNKFGSSQYLGVFNTPEEAFQVYKAAKEAFIRELALTYQASLSSRAFNALMSYTVDMAD